MANDDAPDVTIAETIEANGEPTDATNSILKAIAGVSADIQILGQRVGDHDEELRSLRRAIHGSKAPPPVVAPDGTIVIPIAEMARRGSVASFDVEELRNELIAVRSELLKQSRTMGIGKRGLDYVFSAAGGKTIVRLATLAGAAYAAFHAAGH